MTLYTGSFDMYSKCNEQINVFARIIRFTQYAVIGLYSIFINIIGFIKNEKIIISSIYGYDDIRSKCSKPC